MATPTIDYGKLADQARGIDYSALADQARTESAQPEQSFGEALREYGRKMNPVPMLTGMGNAMLHPIEFTKNWMAQNEKLAQDAEQAYKEGRGADAIRHATNYFINSMPGFGTASQEAGDKLEKGDIAGGLADSAALASQTALGIKTPAILNTAGRLKSATGAGIKAAAPGIASGLIKAGAGEVVGQLPVLKWPARVAIAYPAGLDVARGLKAGAGAFRESLFPPPIAPKPVPPIGEDPAAMYSAQQARLNSQATAPTATTAAPAVPQPTRPQTPARVQPGAGAELSPIDKIASAVQPPAAMLSRLNTGVTVNPRAAAQNLFNEMKRSGSLPETARAGESFGGEVQPPDKFIAQARATRAANTDQLVEALHRAGIRSADLENVTAAEWEALAKAKNIGWPIGAPARRAWVQDVIDSVRRREGRVQ